MLRSHEGEFSRLDLLSDFLIAFGAWMVCYLFRFKVLPLAQPGLVFQFALTGVLIGLLTIYFFSKSNVYRSHRMNTVFDEIWAVLRANVMALAFLLVFFYFFTQGRMSRLVFITYFVLSCFLFATKRVFIRQLLREIRRRGHNLRHALLIGCSSALEDFAKNTKFHPELGIRFIGWVDSAGLAEKYGVTAYEAEALDRYKQLEPDAMIIGYPGAQAEKTDQVLRKVYNDVCPVVVLPDLAYSYIGYHIDMMAGVPALNMNEPQISLFDLFLKRWIDIAFSGMGLVVLSPVMLVLGVLIKLSSPGPIFFGQERVGLDGTKFKMWKFRSMRVGSGAPGWTIENDPRRTKTGTFIRATSLDELPQLWNVFIGEMSLVGPRPEQPFYVEKFRQEIPAYMLRHKMKAGITGWAQVNGWRGDTSLHRRIEFDLYYIRHWSLWLDIKIVLLTLIRGFINRNAY